MAHVSMGGIPLLGLSEPCYIGIVSGLDSLCGALDGVCCSQQAAVKASKGETMSTTATATEAHHGPAATLADGSV